jgi:DNA-binding response OmpR family regulator
VSKRILLIDSDEAFAQGLSNAMKARGFSARLATDSEKGMSMAKEENPDLIVVCVEAQPTNGYMVCTRLKKDDQLKSIPVILTSSTATAESFEKHKKLKTRAEEYLIKPFAPQVMLEKASQLLGVKLGADSRGEEEIVSVEDEPLGLADLVDGEDEPISLSAADAAEARSALTEEPLLVEEVEEVVEEASEGGGDDELEMFDKAFDSIGAAGAVPNATTRFPDLDLGPDPSRARRSKGPAELSEPEDGVVLHSLGEEPAAGSGGELARLKKELSAKTKAVAALQKQQTRLEEQAQGVQQRADALAAAAKKFERELGEAKKGGGEESKARVAKLEKELESVRSEKDLLGEERDALKRQLEEALHTSGQNEDRAVKAYAKMKSEEKLREKARKALQIALQLLEESGRDDDEDDGKKLSAKA